MEITRKNILLADKVNANLLQVDGLQLWDEFKSGVCTHLQVLYSLLSTDIDSLSDAEFLEYFNMLYDVNLNENDELDLISMKYAKRFEKLAEISTTMVINDDIGQKKRLTWEQLFQVKYIVAVAEGKNIDLTKVYSKDELDLMLEDNDIVILDKVIEKIDFCDFDREMVTDFPVENISNVFGKFIRSRVNKEDIDKDINAYYSELIEHIKDVACICSKMERCELLDDLKNTIDRFLAYDNGVKRS